MGAVMCSWAGEWEMKTVEPIAEQIFPGRKIQMNFVQANTQQRNLYYTVVSTSVSGPFLLWLVTFRV